MKNRASAAGMTVVLLVLFCRSIVFADANYQINVSSNIEYAVFTLTYSGSVSGLQITSPDGVVFDQSTCGAAYSTPTGQIKIGVRTAVAGKWKIHISGSPDNGFQIAVASDASYGNFAGAAVTSTPSPIPSPTPSPVPTSNPTPTATPVPPTPTPRPKTSTPTPTQTIPTDTAIPTVTELPIVVITPTSESITDDTSAQPNMSTLTPTATPKVSETTLTERESTSVNTKEKKESFSFPKMTKHTIAVVLFFFVCTVTVIGFVWLFLLCLKKRKQLQKFLHNKKERIAALYRLQKNKFSAMLAYQREKDEIVRKRQACEIAKKRESAFLVKEARLRHKRERAELASLKTTERKSELEKKKTIFRQERLRVENERLERAQKSKEEQKKTTSDQLAPKLDNHKRKTKMAKSQTEMDPFICFLVAHVKSVFAYVKIVAKKIICKKKKPRASQYYIYQLRAESENRVFRYTSYDRLPESPRIDRYELVCFGLLHWSMNVEGVISHVRESENTSLSVSDIVVLDRPDFCEAYYIDYKKCISCPDFATQHLIQYKEEED